MAVNFHNLVRVVVPQLQLLANQWFYGHQGAADHVVPPAYYCWLLCAVSPLCSHWPLHVVSPLCSFTLLGSLGEDGWLWDDSRPRS